MIDYYLSCFDSDGKNLAAKIKKSGKNYKSIYAVPQGGVPLGLYLSNLLQIPLISETLLLTENPDTILIVDDVVDSGATRKQFNGCDFASLHIKTHTPKELIPEYYIAEVNGWVQYWWEPKDRSMGEHVTRILQYIGEDPTRTGLQETPSRVVKSWAELFEGYNQNPEDVCKVFDEDKPTSGLVYLKNIEFYSFCEHHMLPFYGKALIAYIPVDNRVIGVSKLARLLDIYARRLQIQERIAEQVTDALMEHLKPAGAACIIEAKHLCIACRGVQKQHSIMGYSSLKGIFLEKEAARLELMSLLK